ncbi:MAG: SET domain-containing protein-lysine N-methyltransferase [Proteobacteria bacterium]|nr:SET domain-containing protein-lysine N-methyltransferase [Pseudomonadota bacterium]
MLYPDMFGRDPLFPKHSDFAVVFKDDMVGRGVMTYRSFTKGAVIARMAGHLVHDIRQHTLQFTPDTHLYDPYFSGFFLHSCSPNISLNMVNLLVVALKDIAANTFLYMDYAETEDVLFKQFPCSCGADCCRGWITGRKEMINGEITAPQYLSHLNQGPR